MFMLAGEGMNMCHLRCSIFYKPMINSDKATVRHLFCDKSVADEDQCLAAYNWAAREIFSQRFMENKHK